MNSWKWLLATAALQRLVVERNVGLYPIVTINYIWRATSSRFLVTAMVIWILLWWVRVRGTSICYTIA